MNIVHDLFAPLPEAAGNTQMVFRPGDMVLFVDNKRIMPSAQLLRGLKIINTGQRAGFILGDGGESAAELEELPQVIDEDRVIKDEDVDVEVEPDDDVDDDGVDDDLEGELDEDGDIERLTD